MDQRAIGKRADYLRFESPVLSKSVAIAGHVSMELYAATDGPDTDFMVKLVDVYPDGYEAIVLDAPIRARYRNGRMPDDVKMMTPNVPEKFTIDLWETAITFEPGHKIAVHVASTASPKFEAESQHGRAFRNEAGACAARRHQHDLFRQGASVGDRAAVDLSWQWRINAAPRWVE